MSRVVRLRDIAEIRDGKYLARDNYDLTGQFEVHGAGGLMGMHAVANVSGPLSVMGRIGTIGVVRFRAQGCWVNNNAMAVVAKPDAVDPFYLHLLLEQFDWDTVTAGTAQPFVRKTDLREAQFDLPPLEEQRRIAEVLGALDDRIDALERTRATTLELVTTIADVASEETSRFCRLSELGSHRPGRYLAKEDYDESGRIFVYGSNSVMGCHSTPLYPDPHVVLARIGSNCGAIRLSPAGAWVNNNASAIIPVPGVDVSLLYGVIANLDMSAYRGGTGQPFIQTSALMEAQVPDVRVWKEAGRYKDSLKSSIDVLCQIDLERLELLRSRDLLLPRLVSGELRVAAAEELVEATT